MPIAHPHGLVPAQTTEEGIIAAPAFEHVVSPLAEQQVVAAPPVEFIVAGPAVERVARSTAPQSVISRIAEELCRHLDLRINSNVVTPELWNQMEVVFSAAVDQDPDERQAYLDEFSGLCFGDHQAGDGRLRAGLRDGKPGLRHSHYSSDRVRHWLDVELVVVASETDRNSLNLSRPALIG